MITLQDCIDMCGLTQEQLEAVADHEHIPDIIAAEWAETTLARPDGEDAIEHVLEDEIQIARSHQAWEQAARCLHGLEEFRRIHHSV